MDPARHAERAAQVLDDACDSIYASRNRRQIAQLNFRLAFLTWLRGRRDEAIHLLKSAELHLHKEVDARFGSKCMGSARGFSKVQKTISRTLTHKKLQTGEDRLADLYQDIVQKIRSHSNNFGSWTALLSLSFFDLRFDQRALIFDLLPRGLMVIVMATLPWSKRGSRASTVGSLKP